MNVKNETIFSLLFNTSVLRGKSSKEGYESKKGEQVAQISVQRGKKKRS